MKGRRDDWWMGGGFTAFRRTMWRLSFATWRSAMGLGLEWAKLNNVAAPTRSSSDSPRTWRIATTRDPAASPFPRPPQQDTWGPPPPARASALVMEAKPGGIAVGAFVVANMLAHSVTTRVVWSEFTDESGARGRPKFFVDPAEIVLEPGAEVVVKVAMALPGDVAINCRGEFSVADLPGTRISAILRSIPAVPSNPSDAEADPAPSPHFPPDREE